MKPRTELLLCSGFFFLGGLLLYPIVQSDEVLHPSVSCSAFWEAPVCSFLISPLSGGCYSKSPVKIPILTITRRIPMKTLDLNELLQNHPYPRRGIVLGRSADDKKAVIAYFIMGRSENSRNRVFETTEDGIRTRAYDESKMVDPSLIIYHPVRIVGDDTVVTNGDQTDTIPGRAAGGQGLCPVPAHPGV